MKTIIWTAAISCLLPCAASAQDFGGLRIEARLGYETPTISDVEDGDDDIYKLGSAVSLGGEAGFDLRVGDRVTVGPYVTYEASNVETCDAGSCLGVKDNLGIGGRVGYAVGERGQVYAKLGYARITLTGRLDGATDEESNTGVQGAIGYRMNFGRRLYGAVEANYGDYGDLYDVKLQRRQVVAGLGIQF